MFSFWGISGHLAMWPVCRSSGSSPALGLSSLDNKVLVFFARQPFSAGVWAAWGFVEPWAPPPNLGGEKETIIGSCQGRPASSPPGVGEGDLGCQLPAGEPTSPFFSKLPFAHSLAINCGQRGGPSGGLGLVLLVSTQAEPFALT